MTKFARELRVALDFEYENALYYTVFTRDIQKLDHRIGHIIGIWHSIDVAYQCDIITEQEHAELVEHARQYRDELRAELKDLERVRDKKGVA